MAFPGIGAILSGAGGLLSRGASSLASFFSRGAGGQFLKTGAQQVIKGMGNPFIGTVAGLGAAHALGFTGDGDEGGGGAGDPENIQASTQDVIGTLLDGGSDGMVRSAWRVARAMGATPASLFNVIRSLDMNPVDKMAISSELERVLKARRRRRSVVPKSIIRALALTRAVQQMTSMRLRVKEKRRGR